MNSRAERTCLTISAVWCVLLAGCSPHQDGQQHALTAESRLRVADAAEASGDRQTAISMYTAAANESPNDTQIQLRGAEGLARNGSMEDASAILARRLKATPHDADLQGTLGAIQIMSGEPARAVLTLTEVLAINPHDTKAMVNKAVAFDILHKHDQAQDLYRKALRDTPDDVTINNDLALSLLLSGHRDEARLTMLPFHDSPNLSERIKTNVGILDAASGHPVEAGQILGSRIGASDLASLTQAVSMQSSGFQPDGGTRIVSRGILTEPVIVGMQSAPVAKAPATQRAVLPAPTGSRPQAAAAPTLPAVHQDVPLAQPPAPQREQTEPSVQRAVVRRPLQEQGPARSAVSAAGPAVADVERPVTFSQPVASNPPVASGQSLVDVKPIAPMAARMPSPVPPPPMLVARGDTSAPHTGSTVSRPPLQDSLVPRNVRAAQADARGTSRSLVQEPLPPPALTGVRADANAVPHRPLQEQAAAAGEPVTQSEKPPTPSRPLQEQAAGAAIVPGLPR